MISRDDISTIINALILAELNVDEHIEWDQESRREYLGSIRLARSNIVKEQRRARKARKNLVMYKTAGRRPWKHLDAMGWYPFINDWTGVSVRPWRAVKSSEAIEIRGKHLRERSGFLAMSRLATFLQYGVDFSKREHADFVGQGRRDD